ncbi:endocuticle structural glycoprotein ABD-4-like [Uranotaenia lowii]|uniref:endocuticle structural glycoprotein ABD-4-like n=1 Tax=Uranotaenia lowii TaxID=190385 RepID=UPI00247AAE6A|nr:endocuticle structural glycoprotein ABD-4-like [Uranotaenia lowii]
MKFPIFAALLLIASARPQHSNNNNYNQQQQNHEKHLGPQETTTWIPILKYNKEQGEDGSYKHEYQTGNNIVHEESGYLKDFSEAHPNGILVQQGAYSYEAPDGQIIHVQYTADERGFRVVSDHLPTEPPIPVGIQKGLEEIYAGIKRREQELKSNPKYAETAAQRAELDYHGQYYQQ